MPGCEVWEVFGQVRKNQSANKNNSKSTLLPVFLATVHSSRGGSSTSNARWESFESGLQSPASISSRSSDLFAGKHVGV